MHNTRRTAVIILLLSCCSLWAKDPEISWTGQTSGTIIYPADEYAPEEHKHEFSDVKFKYKSETLVINKNLEQDILKDFINTQRNIIRRENFLKSDIGFLASINYVVVDEDYTEIDGKIAFNYKYDPIVIFKVPIEKFEQNFRVSFVNDIMIATNWETGQRRIKRFPLSEMPPSSETIQKVIPSVFSKSALKVFQ